LDSLTDFALTSSNANSQKSTLAEKLHPLILNRLRTTIKDEFPYVKDYSLSFEIYDLQ
jgi:hypothetical protein